MTSVRWVIREVTLDQRPFTRHTSAIGDELLRAVYLRVAPSLELVSTLVHEAVDKR